MEIYKKFHSDLFLFGLIDKFQSIVSQRPENEKSFIVPYNIFDDFYLNGQISFINYAAAYGSIKCFKYLLSNQHKIDENTLESSFCGGNIEIIKIVNR